MKTKDILKRKIEFHMDAFKSLYKKPKYVSWLHQKSHHERKDDCVRLKSRIVRQSIPEAHFYDHCELGTPRADIYTWADPIFLSKKHNDIKYCLCIRTLQYAFNENCLSKAIEDTNNLLTEEEKKNEEIQFIKKENGFYEAKFSENRYDKLDGKTVDVYKHQLFHQYLENPPDSIEIQTGFSVTHICSHSVFAVGTVNVPFLTIPVTNSIIDEFLSLEDEFLPILYDTKPISKNRYMENRFSLKEEYFYENWKDVSRDNLILDKGWFDILLEKYASQASKDALLEERRHFTIGS